MVSAIRNAGSRTETQGHVALYARDARWRKAAARSLEEAGHSHGEAANPEELQQLLRSLRFDVLALNVRDEQETLEISKTLKDAPLPPHTILVGNACVLPLTLHRKPGATFRYAPGSIPAKELSRLVDVSIKTGTWDEPPFENGDHSQLEEVDLQEIIEDAASTVMSLAHKKRQRFQSAIAGPTSYAFADRRKLHQALVSVLKLIVSLAPRGALISVDATGNDDWIVRISVASRRPATRWPTRAVESLREEGAKVLTAVSRSLRNQGGMLWVDLQGSAGLAFSLTLPIAPEPALPAAVPAHMKGVRP